MATVQRVCRNAKRLSPLRPPTIPKGDLATRFALLRTALAAFVPLLLLVQWAKLEWLVEDARIASNKGGDNCFRQPPAEASSYRLAAAMRRASQAATDRAPRSLGRIRTSVRLVGPLDVEDPAEL
jgi:hypothetical protein